jgi:hypothetical protein
MGKKKQKWIKKTHTIIILLKVEYIIEDGSEREKEIPKTFQGT